MSKLMTTFTLSDEDVIKVEQFSKEQDAIVFERQKLEGSTRDSAYYGAVGGELTYTFTPSGIATFTSVQHSGTGAVLDLMEDYDF